MKKLYRSREHRMVSGVLGGLGDYFSVDPMILRIIFALVVLVTGVFPGIILYLFAILVMPKDTFITHSAPIIDDDPAI